MEPRGFACTNFLFIKIQTICYYHHFTTAKTEAQKVNVTLGRFPGVGTGSPLQYSCLVNSMDRGAWWAMVLWGMG